MTDVPADEILLLTTTLGAKKVRIEKIEGSEGLSELFCYRLEFVAFDSTTDYASLIGTSATVAVQSNDGARRHFNGIITRVRLVKIDAITGETTFEADLRPKFWKLGLKSDCKIWLDKTSTEIIKAVLDASELSGGYTCNASTTAKREYCVQYLETPLAFVMRLMEEEGLFFYFTHADGSHKLIIDSSTATPPDCPGVSTLNFRENITSNQTEEDIVSQVIAEERLVSDGVAVHNYNFETPSTSLLSTAGKTTLQMMAFPELHLTTSVGEGLATKRLEALELEKKTISGEGTLPTLIAGYKFTLAKFPKAALNQAYVVRRLFVEADRHVYRARFLAFPSSVHFAPPRVTPKPRIPSTQTAVVVGKSGEEQWVDKYGRIKVQFHWDRYGQKDENSSCWVRVSQALASKSWGMVAIPRVGQEVVVSFIEGDPDRPLVTGAVYNAEAMPPYTLPDEQTKSTLKTQSTKQGTGKFNEIRIEDKIDKEEIYIHAQKDMLTEVLNDYTRNVKHDSKLTVDNDNTITIKMNRSRTVSEGNDTLTVSKGTRDVTVKGAETHTNNGDFTHKVDGNYTLEVKGDLSIKVTGALTIQAASIAMKSTSGTVEMKASTGMTVKGGTSLDLIAGTAATLKGGTSLDLKASTTLAAEGLTVSIKGSAKGDFDGGGLAGIKGGLVKIN